MRRLAALLLLILVALPVPTSGQPAGPWQRVDPAAAGWRVEALDKALEAVERLRPTSFVIVQAGRIVATRGDVAQKVNVASVRKSLIGALYGIAVAEGRIRLADTLAELKIDDVPPLTAEEKRATVRDLLMARSGIYHPAAYETADIKAKRPVRGSQKPGAQWFYNNWDFNALGTIYRQQTHEDIFESFARRVARPIGMEDFGPADGRYVREPASIHAAYPFMMSARDLARFGQLYLDGGRWGGRQVVPADWIAASAMPYSPVPRGKRHYGYLWWVLDAERFGPGAMLAAGFGGQFVAVIPAKRLVVAETAARGRGERIRTTAFLDVVRGLIDAAP